MKHKPIPKSLREEVYKKYDGHCGYCGKELEYKDMQVDHVKSVYLNEGVQDDSIDNLMPSCRMCNYYKDILDIDNFRRKIREELSHTCQSSFQTRLAMKYGMITYTDWDGKFYFEKEKGD